MITLSRHHFMIWLKWKQAKRAYDLMENQSVSILFHFEVFLHSYLKFLELSVHKFELVPGLCLLFLYFVSLGLPLFSLLPSDIPAAAPKALKAK